MSNINITPNTTIKQLSQQLHIRTARMDLRDTKLSMTVDYTFDISFRLDDSSLTLQDNMTYCDGHENYKFSNLDPKVKQIEDLYSQLTQEQKEYLIKSMTNNI